MPPPFKGYRGVKQGNPLPHTILNVVVYSIIKNWVMVAVPTGVYAEGITVTVQELVVYFYAENRLVTLPPSSEFLHDEIGIEFEMYIYNKM